MIYLFFCISSQVFSQVLNEEQRKKVEKFAFKFARYIKFNKPRILLQTIRPFIYVFYYIVFVT